MATINWGKSYDGYLKNGEWKDGFYKDKGDAIRKFLAKDANDDGNPDYRTGDWRDFFTALGVMESNFDSDRKDKGYGARNNSFYGKYQIGKGVLQDTGFFDKEGKPTFCVNDMNDFLRNPYAQDTNADGVVDSNDANFQNLRVWRDMNQDGVSEANGLHTLSELNIKSLHTTYKINITRRAA